MISSEPKGQLLLEENYSEAGVIDGRAQDASSSLLHGHGGQVNAYLYTGSMGWLASGALTLEPERIGSEIK
jgi:hypothetical protein